MHIGIIPDGNRRWAKARLTSHRQAYAIGFINAVNLTIFLHEIGANDITFYGLSNDNFRRRPGEQNEVVISQIIDSMSVAVTILKNKGIGVHFYGNIEELADGQQRTMAQIEALLPVQDRHTNLNILINYDMGREFAQGSKRQATREIPACDLVFRSGGMKRLSGFLPKQSAGAELFFSAKLWPDVRREDMGLAIRRLERTKRNFGA